MNDDDPFENALEGADERFVSGAAESRQGRWEDRVIKRIVQSHVGSAAAHAIISQLRSETIETTGESRLSFDAFLSAYPAFPVWLVAQPIPYAHSHVDYGEFQAKHVHWFTKLYLQALEKVPDTWGDGPVGLVFEMLNKNSQFNILHNRHGLPPNIKGTTVRIVDPKSLPDGPLFLEPLDFFLHSIGWFGTGE